MKIKKRLTALVSCLLIGAMVFSVYRLYTLSLRYENEENVHRQVWSYRPTDHENPAIEAKEASREASENPSAPTVVNQSVLDLQNEVNGDIIGWLTIDGTAIDYPFVQAGDNDYYLHRDIYGGDAFAGSIFLDSGNKSDLGDFNSVLYGHNMKNGGMFGGVKLFGDADYFNGHKTGALYTVYGTYSLKIIAHVIVPATAPTIYMTGGENQAEKDEFLEFIRQNADRYRTTDLSDGNKVLTLSTCSYASDKREILVAVMEKK